MASVAPVHCPERYYLTPSSSESEVGNGGLVDNSNDSSAYGRTSDEGGKSRRSRNGRKEGKIRRRKGQGFAENGSGQREELALRGIRRGAQRRTPLSGRVRGDRSLSVHSVEQTPGSGVRRGHMELNFGPPSPLVPASSGSDRDKAAVAFMSRKERSLVLDGDTGSLQIVCRTLESEAGYVKEGMVGLGSSSAQNAGEARLVRGEGAPKGDLAAGGADMDQALPSPMGLTTPEGGESSLSSNSMAVMLEGGPSCGSAAQGNRAWRHELEIEPKGPGWENLAGDVNPRGNHESDGMNLSGCMEAVWSSPASTTVCEGGDEPLSQVEGMSKARVTMGRNGDEPLSPVEETCEESVTELGPVGQVVKRSEGEPPPPVEGVSEGKVIGQVGEDAPWPLGEGASGETPGSASLGSNVQATVSEEALVKSEEGHGDNERPKVQ